MTFLELQDFVLSDRFAETKRDEAKVWINHRYGRIWAMEPWTFKFGTFPFTLPQGDDSELITGDITKVYDLSYISGNTPVSLTPIRPEDWNQVATTTQGIPDRYTMVQGYILVSPVPSSSISFSVYGEMVFTPLVGDNDVPLIPLEFHPTLAHGAISEGLRLEADPAWQGAEQDFVAGLENMKQGYLTSVRTYQDTFPSWP